MAVQFEADRGVAPDEEEIFSLLKLSTPFAEASLEYAS